MSNICSMLRILDLSFFVVCVTCVLLCIYYSYDCYFYYNDSIKAIVMYSMPFSKYAIQNE